MVLCVKITQKDLNFVGEVQLGISHNFTTLT